MRFLSRSNLLGLLSGAIVLGLARWGAYAAWWWYDNLAHLLGGLALGSLVASRQSPLGQDLAIVLSLSLIWEVFEYRERVFPWGETPDETRDVPDAAAAEDTLLDTILVTFGAYLGARWAK